jgi:hypothetical protein
MRNRRPNRPNPWMARQLAIKNAERLIAKADALFALDADTPKRYRASLLRAAVFYEAAAFAYQRGTLGLMARKPWARAKECYRLIGHESGVAKCDSAQSEIPVYWEGDEPSSGLAP